MTDPRPEFQEFRTLVEQAEAEAEVAVVANLVEASRRDYRAALAWLERRAPERWRPGETHLDRSSTLGVQDGVTPIAEPEQVGTGKTLIFPAAYMHDFARYLIAAQQGDPLPVWPGEERMKGFRESSDDDDV